ncbi:hypothetical protein GCM10018780_87920 [Streptomyces lanatus]|nr:hypothetical protein GCM10018780_87920 [Streptomyces lanatus]
MSPSRAQIKRSAPAAAWMGVFGSAVCEPPGGGVEEFAGGGSGEFRDVVAGVAFGVSAAEQAGEGAVRRLSEGVVVRVQQHDVLVLFCGGRVRRPRRRARCLR